ncbi:MAG TPA: DUF748 domain-containing protein [Methyloversatilis sp.]
MPAWLRRLLIASVVLTASVLLAFQLAVRTLRAQVEAALGPRGEVARIELGLNAVVLHGLRIRADRDAVSWPTEDELRASRVEVIPQLRDLLSARVSIARITIDGAYLSMLRTRDGALRVLPALLDARASTHESSSGAMPDIRVSRIELRDGAIDFYDASLRRKPHRLALDQVMADIGPIELPRLDNVVGVRLSATVKGPLRDGRVDLRGDVVPATRDANLQCTLRGVDLVAFQPYLIQAAETGVKRGTMDLDLNATVSDRLLKAPGKLTLSGLELSSDSTFMGLPRAAVVGMLKDENERIGIGFTLEGRLDDPKFSLNEGLATRLASSFADSLGVSFGGLVRGVGSAGSSVVEGVGEAVGKLFGR